MAEAAQGTAGRARLHEDAGDEASRCPNCGARTPAEDRFCTACGREAPSSIRPPWWRRMPWWWRTREGRVGLLLVGIVLADFVFTLALPSPLADAFSPVSGVALTGLPFYLYLAASRFRYASCARGLAWTLWAWSGLVVLELLLPLPPAALLGTLVAQAFLMGGVAGTLLAFLLVPGPWDADASRSALVALVGAPLLTAAVGVGAGISAVVVLMLASAGVASLAWITLGYLVSRHTVLRSLASTKARLVHVGDPVVRARPLEVRGLLRLALAPLLFSYAIAAWIDPFVSAGDAQGLLGDLARHAVMLQASLVVLAVASVLVVPGKWLFDALDMHAYDPATGITRPFGVPRFLGDAIGAGAFFGVVMSAFGSGRAVTEEGVIVALTTLFSTAWLLLPLALLATFLYVRHAMQRDLDRFVAEVGFVHVDHLRELAER